MSDKTDIIELELTVRSYNALIAENVRTIENLKDIIKENKLRQFVNLGYVSQGEIISRLLIYLESKNNVPKNAPQLDQDTLKRIVEDQCYGAIDSYLKHGAIHYWGKNLVQAALAEMKERIESKLFQNINELRTLVLEQSRILEGMQALSNPNSLINKIMEIHELHKKLSE